MWQVQHLEDLSLILRGRCSTGSTSVSFCVAGAAPGAPPGRSAKVRRQLSTMDAGGVCVARPALEPRQSHFAWQAQHSDHLIVILRGRCSTRRMSREVRRSPATIEYYGRRLLLRGECNTWRTSVSFCVAGAALGTPQSHFAWQGAEIGASQGHFALQVQQLVRGSPATEYYGRGLLLRGRRSIWSTSVSFCVAGAALGAPQSHFAWLVCHFAWHVHQLEHLERGPRKSGND